MLRGIMGRSERKKTGWMLWRKGRREEGRRERRMVKKEGKWKEIVKEKMMGREEKNSERGR